MEKFDKLMKKKMEEGNKLSPVEKNAKMSVLQHLHKMASDSMADKLHGFKKISVAAPDEKGLESGLDKAKQIVSNMPDMLEDSEDGDSRDGDIFAGGEDEESESPEMEQHEHEMSPGEEEHEDEASIDAKLAHLMSKKQALKSKKA